MQIKAQTQKNMRKCKQEISMIHVTPFGDTIFNQVKNVITMVRQTLLLKKHTYRIILIVVTVIQIWSLQIFLNFNKNIYFEFKTIMHAYAGKGYLVNRTDCYHLHKESNLAYLSSKVPPGTAHVNYSSKHH